MEENKEKIHEMIEGISNAGIVEYLATFIWLFPEKRGGASNG